MENSLFEELKNNNHGVIYCGFCYLDSGTDNDFVLFLFLEYGSDSQFGIKRWRVKITWNFYSVGLRSKDLEYFLSGSGRLGLVIFVWVEEVNILGYFYYVRLWDNNCSYFLCLWLVIGLPNRSDFLCVLRSNDLVIFLSGVSAR